MFKKIYLSRSQTKSMASEYPVGDPTGGAAYGEKNDPVTALVAGGTSLVGSLIGSNAAQSAANTQANATNYAANVEQQMFNTQNAQQAPYRQAGYTALNQLLGGTSGQVPQYDSSGNITGYTTGSGSFTSPFTTADLNSQLAPNYQFMLNQGLGATGQNANVGGGGSNVSTAQTKFAEDYAQNAYQQAFSNYQTQQGNIYNRLASLAGLGQSAQNATSNLAANTASSIGSAAVGGANAQAAGTVGSANALSSGLSSIGNIAALYGLQGSGSSLLGSGTNYLGGSSSYPSNSQLLSSLSLS